jgi:hypothetical protein
MKNLYRRIALRLPQHFTFIVSVLAYLDLTFPEITKKKNHLIQQLATLLYLKKQLHGEWPIENIVTESQFYIEQTFLQDTINM